MLNNNVKKIRLPKYGKPWPHQAEAGNRYMSNKYPYTFFLWPRQCVSLDTPIQTKQGLIQMKDVRPGTMVKSMSNSGEFVYNKVTEKFKGANDKPCIRICKGESYVGTLSYDHPVYYEGQYQELYKIVWRIMDANQRDKLRLLCFKHGQSLDKKILRTSTMSNSKTKQVREVCLQGQRILPSCSVCEQKETTIKSSQTSSTILCREQKESTTSKSYGRGLIKQCMNKFRMNNKRRKHETQVINNSKENELSQSERDTKKLNWKYDEQGNVLQSESKRVRLHTKQHTVYLERTDLSIEEPQQLYDISVENTHNFLIGKEGIVCHNCGKDTTCIELALNKSFKNPGSSSAYVGLDHKGILDNMYKKRVNGREFWSDYEDVGIDANATNKEVLLDNPCIDDGLAASRIKFIGFKNESGLIGSSYDFGYISESSLYRPHAFEYIQPIWEQQEARGELSSIVFNGTPRGVKNNYYELLRTYTGVDDPADFPGEHGDCYVDKKTIHDIMIPDGHGGGKPLYTPEKIEKLKDRVKRQFGNLNLYYQEYECDFRTVNAGLVYQGIERLVQEKRFINFNLDTSKPVYLGGDIGSKGKMTDATACIIFQYINNKMMIYDYYEWYGKSLVECIAELSTKGFFNYVRMAALPGDSERSASSETPIEEARKQYPNIRGHALAKERVDRGIHLVREKMPNMIIHKDNCERLYDAIMNYEFKFMETLDDWSATPKHNGASHGCDCLRYCCMLLGEMNYLKINDDGSEMEQPTHYGTRKNERRLYYGRHF